jgi:hypothetical protein
MKRLLVAILVSISFAGHSQAYTNIVPDSSFERLKPCYDTGVFYGVGSSTWLDYWKNGNEGSSDFFMSFTCTPSNITLSNYPGSGYGYQYPKSGNCYAGLCVMIKPTRNLNFREYLRTELLMPLEAGKKYYAGCYVSIGEYGDFYSVNNFGIAFSVDSLIPDTSIECCPGEPGHPIIFNAQVMNDTIFNLSDTLGWVLVADTFIAQGGEKWLTIGNFRDDAHSVFVPTSHPNSVDSASYYFVDDVFLFCIDTSCATVPVIGIKETQTYRHNFGLYPNPAIHEITVEIDAFNDQKSALLRIYDLAGRLRKSDELLLHSGKGITSIADLPNGAYFVEVIMNGFVRSVQKLIILK